MPLLLRLCLLAFALACMPLLWLLLFCLEAANRSASDQLYCFQVLTVTAWHGMRLRRSTQTTRRFSAEALGFALSLSGGRGRALVLIVLHHANGSPAAMEHKSPMGDLGGFLEGEYHPEFTTCF